LLREEKLVTKLSASTPGQFEPTNDLNVVEVQPLEAPTKLQADLPITAELARHVTRARHELRQAIHGYDRRIVVIVGPCSIHDPRSALEYAERLARLRASLADRFILVMRVYFEKPRTTVGWKGFISDPHLDGSGDINTGLRRAREVLIAINSMGLPCATEFLDPIVPQYTADLVSWSAIGARTTESQTHREMASGLSMPVGFKNSTDGDIQTAINAIEAARRPHSFVGIDPAGTTAIIRTKGNSDVHLVLRGGGGHANHTPPYVAFARVALGVKNGLRPILVDCSHDNSGRDPRRQPEVFRQTLDQIVAGESCLLGMMLESHLVEGTQKMGPLAGLCYGQSITDACIDWPTTEAMLRDAHARLH